MIENYDCVIIFDINILNKCKFSQLAFIQCICTGNNDTIMILYYIYIIEQKWLGEFVLDVNIHYGAFMLNIASFVPMFF